MTEDWDVRRTEHRRILPANTGLKGPPPLSSALLPEHRYQLPPLTPHPNREKGKLTISRKDLLILIFGNFSTKRLLDNQLMRTILATTL